MMARRRSKGLTDRQHKILEVLDDYYKENGYPPSIREICKEANISSTSVTNYYLTQLEEMGYIERDGHVSRGIRLVKPLDDLGEAVTAPLKQAAKAVRQVAEDFLRLPLMGRIVASAPAPVPSSDFNYFDAESFVDVARSMLPSREKGDGLYALEVQGDSMIDAMINDGDIVIMKPVEQARNGELVAIWLRDRDETTLKYFFRENGRVRLQPANPTMKPIYIDDPRIVQVQGKVVMVVRKVKDTPLAA
jgi:repressor LexA